MQRWQFSIHNGTFKSFFFSRINYINAIILKSDNLLSTKVTCAFLLQENILKFSEINTLNSKKGQCFPHYLLYKSGIAIFAERVTWIYAYNPLKERSGVQWKTTFRPYSLVLSSLINMKHSNFTIYTDPFHLISLISKMLIKLFSL